jgi:hypothetical protein
MAFSFEVHPDMEFDEDIAELDAPEIEEQGDDESLVNYDGLFEEEDFIALGINPSQPTESKPGSDGKVLMLAARYAAGLPLWHDSDCYDHGPGEATID